MSSNLKIYSYAVIIVSFLLIANFNLFVSFNSNYGGSLTDYSNLNRTDTVFGYVTEIQQKAGEIQETDIGGFKVILGGLNVAVTLLDISGIFTGLLGELADIIGIPSWATALLLLGILISLIVSYYNIVWGRHKA